MRLFLRAQSYTSIFTTRATLAAAEYVMKMTADDRASPNGD